MVEIRGRIKMILYHAVTAYQLLEIVLFNKIHNNDENACILITSKLIHDINEKELLKKFKIFQYDFNRANELKVDYFDNLFRENNINIKKFTKIYVPCAHHGFGIYLCQKNIKFIFFEDAAGAISRYTGVIKIEEKNQVKNELALKFGLYEGCGKYIQYRIGNINAQEKSYDCSTINNFSVEDALLSLDIKDIDKVLKLFTNKQKIKIDGMSVIILTEHLANLNILTWNEQIYMYQILVDYFCSDKFIIWKPHPDDILNYEDFFLNTKILKDKIPAELMPFLFIGKINKVITVSSTSINNLKKYTDNSLQFNQEFSYKKQQFYLIHKYFVCIYAFLKMINDYNKIYIYGVNKIIVSNILEVLNFKNIEIIECNSIDNFNNLPRNSFLIVDEMENEDICELLIALNYLTVCFINSQEDYVFYHPSYHDIWENIEIIEIEKRKIRDDNVYDNLQNEQIYIYSKEYIKMEKFSKKLKYTGIEITAEMFEDDKKKIKILEAMLRASENRLLYYMNEKNNSRGEN